MYIGTTEDMISASQDSTIIIVTPTSQEHLYEHSYLPTEAEIHRNPFPFVRKGHEPKQMVQQKRRKQPHSRAMHR